MDSCLIVALSAQVLWALLLVAVPDFFFRDSLLFSLLLELLSRSLDPGSPNKLVQQPILNKSIKEQVIGENRERRLIQYGRTGKSSKEVQCPPSAHLWGPDLRFRLE